MRGALSPSSAPAAGTWVASAAIVVALPLLAALSWYSVRGRATARASTRGDAAPADHREVGRDGHPGAEQGARLVSSVTATTVEPPPDPSAAGTGAGNPRRRRWTRQVSGVTSRLTGVAWSGTRAVVVGSEGMILTSADLVAWQAAPQPHTYSFFDATYGRGLFVAVGSNLEGSNIGRVVSASADGASWSTQSWPDRVTLSTIAFGNGVFVAAGQSAVSRSLDGERWDTVTPPTGEYLSRVTYIDDRFVLIGLQGASFESRDGLTWAAATGRAPPMEHVALAAGGGLYLLLGQAPPATEAEVWRSSDRTTWTRHVVKGVRYLVGPTFTGKEFIAVGEGILSSLDGLDWTSEVPAADFTGYTALWTGSTVIAVGQQGAIYTSTTAQP